MAGDHRAARRAPSRRSVLATGLGGLAGLALPGVAACGGGGGALLGVTALGDRLSMVSGAGGNVLALATDDGFVLVDSGDPNHDRDLAATLRQLPGRGPNRVRTIINTHYHLDHTGGNATLGRSGAAILAHVRTKLRMSTPTWRPELEVYRPAQPEAAWPTETFYTQGETTAGDERIAYGHLIHAHTDGDIYIHFRDSNVIAVGDVVSPVRDPEFDWFAGGWLGGRVDALALLLEIVDEETRIAPGYGPLVTRAELQAEHDMITTLYERTHALFRQGRSAADMLEEGALDGLGRDFDDPGKLLYDIHKGLWGHQSSMSPDIV